MIGGVAALAAKLLTAEGMSLEGATVHNVAAPTAIRRATVQLQQQQQHQHQQQLQQQQQQQQQQRASTRRPTMPVSREGAVGEEDGSESPADAPKEDGGGR